MTPLSTEILEKYQIRKTKKQKTAFIDRLRQNFPDLTLQKGGFPQCRNIIIGDPESAKIVMCAHYDTCARMPIPNFIAPKNPVLSILYSLLVALPIFIVILLANLLLHYFAIDLRLRFLISAAICFILLLPMFIGPANKNTANDNTSGVIVLCELLQSLDCAQRNKVAFVFFDHEETGLIGSSYFRNKYKLLMKDKLLINFDCVSDGDHILVAANKSARNEYGELLKSSFKPTETKNIVFTNAETTLYPSDQRGFKQSVAIAAMKRKKGIGYYLDRIHTSRDTEFDKSNIKLLCESTLTFLKQL